VQATQATQHPAEAPKRQFTTRKKITSALVGPQPRKE